MNTDGAESNRMKRWSLSLRRPSQCTQKNDGGSISWNSSCRTHALMNVVRCQPAATPKDIVKGSLGQLIARAQALGLTGVCLRVLTVRHSFSCCNLQGFCHDLARAQSGTKRSFGQQEAHQDWHCKHQTFGLLPLPPLFAVRLCSNCCKTAITLVRTVLLQLVFLALLVVFCIYCYCYAYYSNFIGA